MPEYLAPGVYVEETSFRARSIEGVSTSTTAFVGPARKGPVGGIPELITSFGDFERIYGGLSDLQFDGQTATTNYLAHSVQAYFNNGGGRLYVSRAFLAVAEDNDGQAVSANVVDGADAANRARFVARFPGRAGGGRIVLRQSAVEAAENTAAATPEGTLLRVVDVAATTFYVKRDGTWTAADDSTLAAIPEAADTTAHYLSLNVLAEDGDGNQLSYEDLGFDSAHPRWLGHVLAAEPARRSEALENLYGAEIGANVSAFALQNALFGAAEERIVGFPTASAGNDGLEPTNAAYQAALTTLEQLEDISIVAAPGSSAYTDEAAIRLSLISHAERRRAYRIAVLDTPPAQGLTEARAVRARIDSHYAALYYPWVVVANPLARPGNERIPREIALPPSGFVCGIYARNDVSRGVHKAPANEVVRGALRFESNVNFAQQEVLNPLGVNCLRYFPGRGNRVWGARTASSDPEWKYVNVRRYFLYLEQSIDRSTQWAVFEPNGERLWANVREAVEGFLYNEWRGGALLGASPKEAYFVRCDRSTMTQNDLDNGRLICLIGVAALKPAEFVVFRIGQKTADASN